MNPDSQNHNILYNSDIHAGGNVQIGDNYYNVAQDFKYSILFFRIEHTEGSDYTAQLTLKSRHNTQSTNLSSIGLPLLKEQISLNISAELFNQVTEFQNIRRNSGANFRKADLSISEALRWEEEQLSQTLFDTFFKGDILTICQDFVALLEKRKVEELLLAISVNDSAVMNLPFEMVIPKFFPIKLAQERESLAVVHFGLVRTLEKDLASFDMQGKISSKRPLKMLFVTALPENMDERNKMLEIEDEQKRLIDAIGKFEANGGKPNLVIEFLDTASLHEIREALSKHQHNILHISGHGSYQKDVKQGVLHLEDEEGNHCEVTGAALGEAMREHQCVKLLILSACETAIADNGVVEQLAAFGLPAIIAMRFSVTDIGAKIFTTALYDTILKGHTLTHAVAHAREQMWKFLLDQRKLLPEQKHLAEWFTPVVYLNQYTEALVNLEAKYVLPDDFYPRSEFLKSKNTRLIGSGFIGRKRYLNVLRRSFAKGEHVCLHGLGGMGKTTLAEAFADNYENHNHEVIIFRNGNQIAEKFILDELFVRFENDEAANKNTIRQIKHYLESDTNPQEKLQVLIDNYLKNHKTILLFDNFEDVQLSEEGEQQQAIGSASLAEFMTYLCQNTPPDCHLLFTTRYKIVDLAEHLTHLALDKMTFAEQYRLTNFSEILRKIPMSERQDIVKRLDGHPRAYEFLETLLKKDRTLTWTKLSTQIGEVEAKVWEDLLLEKFYQRLNPEEQQLLQVCAVFISRTPMAALEYVIEKAELKTTKLETGGLLGLCFYDNENQKLEVHRLTREWMVRNIISNEKIKEWSLLAGEYFEIQNTLENLELSRLYFEIAEAWESFVAISFRLEGNFRFMGLYKRAYEINIRVLEKNINDKFNAEAFNFIGMTLSSTGQYDLSLKNFEEALIINKKIDNCNGELSVRVNMSEVYVIRGDYNSALDFLNQSKKIAKDINELDHYRTILNNIGQIYKIKGEYDTALDYYNESLSMNSEYDDKGLEGTILNNIGAIYKEKGEYNKCLYYFEKSLPLLKEVGHVKNLAATLGNIGQIYFLKENFITALKFLQDHLEIAQKIGDRKSEGTALNSVGMVYLELGNFEKGLDYLEKSLRLRKEIGDILGMAATLHNLGDFYFRKNSLEMSIHYFLQSYGIHKMLDSPHLKKNINYLNVIMDQIGKEKFQEILQKQNQQ